MSKSKSIVYNEFNGNQTVVLYFSMDGLCQENQETTNWCEDEETVDDLEKSFSIGGAYVITDYGNKFLLTRSETDYKIVNFESSEISLNLLSFDGRLEDFVELLIKPGPFFPVALKKYMVGLIDADEIMSYPKVSNVDEKFSKRGSSMIEFKLTSNDYENMFNLNDDDIFIINAVTTSYGGYSDFTFVDDYHTQENFSEGYWFQSQYNEGNKDKIKQIFSLLHPDWNEEDINVEDDGIYRILYKDFRKLVPGIFDDMMDSANYYHNEEIRDGVSSDVRRQLTQFFTTNGFYFDSRDNLLSSTASQLYMWAVQLRLLGATPKQLLNGIFSRLGGLSGGWYEEYWNFAGEFDKSGFNIDLTRNLDKIVERFEEEYQIEEWANISKEIFSKFKQGYSLPFPNYPDLRLVVDSVNPQTLNVEFKVQKGLQQRNFSMSYEKFNDFIYNKKLFDFESLLGF